MKILISGSTGLIGSAIVYSLNHQGHQVTRLVRAQGSFPEPCVLWSPDKAQVDVAALEGFDAVIHLSGENLAQGRWTESKKARIYDSRVKSTELLSRALAECSQPPKTFLCASAIGYYGDRGDEVLTEDSALGDTFLSRVCRDWEAATTPAGAAGIRVVNLRFGAVLSPKGGAIKAMLTPFKLGAGGVLGTGNQYMSWIAIDDAVGVVQHCLANDTISGPVNTVTPNPVTNRTFTKTFGHVLHRPTILPMPAFAARALLGQVADEVLLASARVQPKKLIDSGYRFAYPELEPGLRKLLGD